MSDLLQEQKTRLRLSVRAELKKISPSVRPAMSEQARALLKRQAIWRQAMSILFFAPLPEELDIWPLLNVALAGGKIVALPRFNAESGGYISCRVQNLSMDLQTGRYGIREAAGHCPPIELNRLDLILVPGVAFDLRGRRLGRGKGFYDQLLALVGGTTCGVAFDEQIVGEIPVEPHDVAVNCILTPTRWIEP